MKITSIDIYQLKTGCADAGYPIDPIICRVNTDEGIYGFGEGSVSIGVGKYAVFSMIRDVAPFYIGRDPFDNEVVWEEIRTKMYGHMSGGGVIVWSALSALDMALMDIKGKAVNLPCCKLLGGVFQDKLPCYASHYECGWGDDIRKLITPEDYAEVTKKIVSEGYMGLKVDPVIIAADGTNNPRSVTAETFFKYGLMQLAEDRIAAIREAAGPNVEIILDTVCRLDTSAAITIDRISQKYNIGLLEEMIDPFRPMNYKVLKDQCKTPLAAGEKVHTRWGFANYFDLNALTVAQPDMANCGGIAETKKIADMAHVYDVKVSLHNGSAPINYAASIQVEAAIPNFSSHEVLYCRTHPDLVGWGIYDYRPTNGLLDVPMIPGIGNEITEKALKEATQHMVMS